MRKPSGATKIKQKRGTGVLADYDPWIHSREVSSVGTKALILDWKTGRQVHCLSHNEKNFYYMLRWDDDVLDINEQFPLDRKKTEKIAKKLGVAHPRNWNDPNECMTTDFLVTKNQNGVIKRIAYSVKNKYDDIFGEITSGAQKRTIEKQGIEMFYWKQEGVEFRNVFGDRDINKVYAHNIAQVVAYYDLKNVNTLIGFMCYLIANKYINVPMEEEPLKMQKLTEEFLGDINKREHWLNTIAKHDYCLDTIRENILLDKK